MGKSNDKLNFIGYGVLLCLLTLSLGCFIRKPTNESQNVAPQASPTQNQHEQVLSPLPPPTGFVNDYANIFDSNRKKQLESLLTELRNKSQIEFAVVTIETTGGQSIFDYSLAVAKGWGIGPKDTSKGGGLLLLFAAKDREWRLQVSRNLETDLPDELCKQLGDQSKDLYKQGRYAEGMMKYARSIIGRLETTRGFKLSPVI